MDVESVSDIESACRREVQIWRKLYEEVVKKRCWVRWRGALGCYIGDSTDLDGRFLQVSEIRDGPALVDIEYRISFN